MTSTTPIHVLTTSRGNDFMIDVARMVEHGFRMAGCAVELRIDVPPDVAAGARTIIVAPHEFFPLFLEPVEGHARAAAANRQVVVLNVEQPGSGWFEIAFAYAAKSRGILDISFNGVIEFRRRGLEARFAPLPFLPSLAVADPPPIRSRPIDVLFVGYNSPRRERFFAAGADRFSRRSTAFVFGNLAGLRQASTPGYYSGRRRADLLAAAKVVFNVHATDYPYFEMHRALLAFGSGCALVSESSKGMGPVVTGLHVATAPLEGLVDECERLLDDVPELERLARIGLDFARASASRQDVYTAVAAWLRDLAEGQSVVAEDETRRVSVLNRLRAAKAARKAGQVDVTIQPNAAYVNQPPVALSVVVTVFNYEDFLGSCLTSVLNSESLSGGIELVVVDDGSRDQSFETAVRMLASSSIPSVVVRKATNTGLADARNTGVAHARGRYVFILDADNWIYPACLPTLHAEIVNSGVAVVYSLIQRFDDESGEPLGLLSTHEWDPAALLRGAYIDAMALVDRRALEDVGGYSGELIEYGWFGWEDYDLWLKFCLKDLRGRLVPRILGAYRSHALSMIRRTNRSSQAIAHRFVDKFAELIRRFPGSDRYFGFPAADLGLGTPAIAATADPPTVLQHCHNLERELAAVHASKSWKVTAPLRYAGAILRKRPS